MLCHTSGSSHDADVYDRADESYRLPYLAFQDLEKMMLSMLTHSCVTQATVTAVLKLLGSDLAFGLIYRTAMPWSRSFRCQ